MKVAHVSAMKKDARHLSISTVDDTIERAHEIVLPNRRATVDYVVNH